MKELKILNSLREQLRKKESSLEAQAFFADDAVAKLELYKATRKRKSTEKKIFTLISNL